MNTQAIENIRNAIVALEEEKERIENQIGELRSMLPEDSGTAPKKRGPGRPKGFKTKKGTETGNAKKPGRPSKSWSPAQRKAAAERAKKMWAKRKREARKNAKK